MARVYWAAFQLMTGALRKAAIANSCMNSDGYRAMVLAIVSRSRLATTMSTSCFLKSDPEGVDDQILTYVEGGGS